MKSKLKNRTKSSHSVESTTLLEASFAIEMKIENLLQAIDMLARTGNPTEALEEDIKRLRIANKEIRSVLG